MKHARGCDGDIPGSPGCICSYPEEPTMDRSDEIRTAVRQARSRAHAAMLREAIGFLHEPVLARAIIELVLRDLEPPEAKAPTTP